MSTDCEWSKDEFRQGLENLREEIKNSLFRQGATVGQTEPTLEDNVIHDILAKLIDKWHIGFEAEEHKVEEGDLKETVVFSTTGRGRLDESVAVSQHIEDTQETIIISAEDFEKSTSPPREVSQISEAGENDIPDTVVMPQSGTAGVGFEKRVTHLEKEPEKPAGPKKPIGESYGDGFLAQTVVLGPDKAKAKAKAKE